MENGTRMNDNISTDNNKVNSVEKNEKIVDVLNSLVEINNDRIEGYGHAAEETDESDLKELFNAMAAKSRVLNSQLIKEVRNYGGTPTEGTTALGKVFRVWMDFKAALTGKDRKAILVSCEFGEDSAQTTYAVALKNYNDLPHDILQLIQDQKMQLNEDHNKVKALRDLV